MSKIVHHAIQRIADRNKALEFGRMVAKGADIRVVAKEANRKIGKVREWTKAYEFFVEGGRGICRFTIEGLVLIANDAEAEKLYTLVMKNVPMYGDVSASFISYYKKQLVNARKVVNFASKKKPRGDGMVVVTRRVPSWAAPHIEALIDGFVNGHLTSTKK